MPFSKFPPILFFRPNRSLILFRDGTQTFVQEPLHALASIGFRCIDVALGIGCDAVHGIELAGLASSVAEAGEDVERVAERNGDLFVRTVGEVAISLSGIFGERDVPNRPVTQRSLCDEYLFHKG